MSWTPREERVYEERSGLVATASIYFPSLDDSLWAVMAAYLEHRSLSYTLARYRHHWYPATYNGPRVIIPCIRTDAYNFWQGRAIDSCADKRWDSPRGPRGDAICYLHSPAATTLVISEGPMDALAAAMTGASAIATLGIGANGPVLAHVAFYARAYPKVIIIPDRDEVGAWVRIQKELGVMGVVSEIREPNNAKDLADMVPLRREELIRD